MRPLPLTPLIDIMFILITFFMLTTTFMKLESMELIFPAGSEKSETISSPLLVDVYEDYVVLDGKKTDMAALYEILEAALKKSPEKVIVLRAGDDTSLQRLVTTMDIIYLTGTNNIVVKALEDTP